MKEKLNEPIYTLTGTVIHGRGIGKHVGTPTANIAIEKKDFLPKTGVYVADILLGDKRYYGVTHIGTRPNLLKGGLNASITFLLYKPIVTALRKSGYVAASENEARQKHTGLLILASFIIVTCVLIILSMNGII